MSDNISQKEWLSFLDLLHNKLRNAKGLKLTQMPALYEISNFMLFRFLDNEKIVGLKIPKEDRMKKIYEKYATDEAIKEDKKISLDQYKEKNCYKLWNAVYNVDGNENCLIYKYIKNQDLKPYLRSTTNKVSAYVGNSKACESIQEIINMIYKKFEDVEFDSKFFDMFGSAYEEFKTNACGNGGKQTAQHFTNVYIKKIIIDELKPKHNEIFYEPCAGSGGFIHTADHYVLEKEGEVKSKIFKKNIFANECNPEIYRPLVLNMLFHNIPISDKDDCNIKEEDSLCNENIMRMKNKCDLIATNFPFGMSTTLEPNKNTEFCWEVLKNGKNNYIKNSSGQFVLHIYHSLKEKGRTGFVSDRGILNNGTDNPKSWESKLRKFMFENANVYKIVLLPQGAFTYTNFQTCIVFMKKGEVTNECGIYEAKFKVEKDKTSEIYVEEKPIKTFKLKDLQKSNYDLGLKEETKDGQIKENWLNLSDVIKFEIGGTPNTSILDYWNGEYNWVSVKELHGNVINDTEKKITKKGIENSSVKLIKKGSIMMSFKLSIGKFGIAGKDMYCNEAIMFFNHENDIVKKYVMYCLRIIPIEEKLLNGNMGNGSLNKKTLGEIKIPDLSKSHQEEIVEFLDKQFELYNIEQLTPYTKDIKLFDLLVHKQYDMFVDTLHVIYRKIEADMIHKKFELDKKAVFNIKVNIVESKKYKLGDLVEISKGTFNTKDTDNSGKYPYYNSGCKNPSGSHSKYSCNNDECIIFVKDGGDKTNPYNENSGMCKPFYVSGKVAVIAHNLIFTNNNKKVYKLKYLYLYLECNRKELMKHAKYNSGLGHITMGKIAEHLIKIPSLQDQQKIIEEIEKIESEQSSYNKYAQMLQEQINNINTMIKNICTIQKAEKQESNDSDTESDNESQTESDSEIEDVKPKKKILKKKVDSNSDSETEDVKPKKKILKKKVDSDSDSEIEDIKSKNKILKRK
jgi:type I restriction enzyme S subunit